MCRLLALVWSLSFALSLSAADLHDASAMFKDYGVRQQDAYHSILQRYAVARQDAPEDAVLAVARCEFIAYFAEAEDISLIDSASDDLEACEDDLATTLGDAPEAKLHRVERAYGKEAIQQGEALLAEAEAWPAPLRGRLLGHLSAQYEFAAKGNSDQRAGELAVMAARLGQVDRLPAAVRALAGRHEEEDAAALLAAAPIAENVWRASQRIEAALNLHDPSAAVAEMTRHVKAGMHIAPGLVARVQDKAGDAAAAQQSLVQSKASGAQEPAPVEELRFRLALDQDPRAAAELVHFADISKGGKKFAQSIQRYAQVLARRPSLALQPPLLPTTAVLLLVALMLLLSPAMLLVPVHYRGLMRRLRARSPEPLFAHVGLRHAWVALALLLLLPMLVLAVLDPAHLAQAFGEEGAASGDAVVQMLAGSALVGLLLLSLPAWRLGRSGWFGNRLGPGGAAWRVVACLMLVWCVGSLVGWWHHGEGPLPTQQTRMIDAAVQSGTSSLGFALTLLIMALLVPVYEELVFRGLLLGGLSRHLSFGWANFWQALLFALVHADPPRFAFYLALALSCGWLVRRSGGLAPAVALHALNNALFLTLSHTLR